MSSAAATAITRSGSKSKTLKPTPKIINIGDTYFGQAYKECKPFKLTSNFLELYNNKKPNFGFNGLGEFVFYRTYSRDKAEGGKESFLDVAKRVVEGCYEIQRRHCMSIHIPWDYERAQDSAQEMFERIWSFKFLPPGRGLWMMGTDFMYSRGSAALNNCFSGDTEYITRDGIKTLKETVGTTQRVLAAGGKWVDAKIKAFGEQELYRLVVKRGVRYKTIMTTADHRWFVKSKQKNLVAANGVEGEKPVYKTRECHTTDLKNGMRLLSCYGSGIKNNYLRPSIVGIQHGICYGDGTTGSSDSNHGTYLYLCGPKNLGLLKYFQGFHVTPAPERGSEGAMRVADLPRFYRNAPVMNEASTYLYGWLAGYFAADGRITKLGTPQISSKYKENLEVVRSVCAILGIGTHDITSGYQTVRYEDGKVKKFLQYRITLYSDHLTDEFFLMEHHLERFKQRTARECSHYENWNVVSVEETGLKEETYCAQVPDYNSFALAGNILTGNCGMTSTDMKRHIDPAEPYCFMMDMSMLGVGIGFDTKGAGQVEIQRPNPAKYVEYEVHDSREGWVDSLRTLLHSYTKKAGNGEVVFNYEKIRPAGSTITGFGGTAAGANILSDMHEMFRKHLDRKVGKTLSSGDIVDLMNYIGKCVVAGNVRRTAQIAFGEAGDEEYSSLKNPYAFMPDNIKSMIQEKEGMAWGRATNSVAYLDITDFDTSSLTSEEIELLTQGTIQWSALNNHRWASNNSVFAKVGMPYKKYEKDIATNGEPGFLWLENCRNFGRMIDGFKEGIDGEVVGSNPCFSGDMRLLTEDGYVSIYDLWVAGGMQEYSGLGDDPVGKYGSQKIVNNDGVVEATNVYRTGLDQDILAVILSDGSVIKATAGHNFIVLGDDSCRRVLLSDLAVGDKIPSNDDFLSPQEQGEWRSTNKKYSSVVSIVNAGKADTYCLTEPETNTVIIEGHFIGQCAEQSLEDSELCCLVESFPNLHQDDEDYKRTLKFAFLYAKTVTLLPTHSARTNAVMLRNRRIGLSQSGIVQAFAQFGRREVLNKFCDEGYNVIKQWDKVYSKWLCIPQSIKITSVKPSGTVSLLTGCTPGIHYPEAQHYWRRVRVKSDSPLVQILKDAGYHVEPSVTDPVNTVVIKFAVSDPRVKPTNEVSIFEQVANTVDYQRYWADNQVSVTIKFKAEEAKDIASVLEIYEDQLKSISFLPHSNHGYAQAPYEPCTEQEVLDYNAQLKDLDFSAYYGKEEGSNFCDSDSCAI